MVRWLALVLLLALPISARAQQDVTTQQVLRGTETEAARKILVIGDTPSGGLGAGLQRMTESETKYDVTFRPNESSGLARIEIYNWAEALPSIVEANDYWAVVVMIGSNDRRDIQDKVFKSPEWIAAYKANADALLDVLKNQGVKVFWVGNPPFKDTALNDDMVFISGLQREQVEKRGETFVDIYAALIGADGKFTDTGPDETGFVRKLRARDGVGFYKEGNNRIAQILLGALEVREADEKFSGTESASETLPDTPLFGRAGVNGEPIIIDSKELATALKQVASGTANDQQKEQLSTAPRSAAEQLFTTGEPVPAPKGRFDDFSVNAQQAN